MPAPPFPGKYRTITGKNRTYWEAPPPGFYLGEDHVSLSEIFVPRVGKVPGDSIDKEKPAQTSEMIPFHSLYTLVMLLAVEEGLLQYRKWREYP